MNAAHELDKLNMGKKVDQTTVVEEPNTQQEEDAQSNISDSETIEQPPNSREGISTAKTYHPLSFPVLALLAPASILGVLARLGLLALTTYDGECIFPLAYVQAFGCFIMGFGLKLKEPLGQLYGPLYTALTTGFCGSVTSFSSWQLDVFESWLNTGQFHRGGLRGFIDGLGKSVFTLVLSLGSLAFGYNVASLITSRLPRPTYPTKFVRYTLVITAVLCYAATFVTYFRLSPSYRHQATAALLFSYPGTLTRYLLSFMLNSRIKALPLGTLAANGIGTALLGACHVIQSMRHPPSPNACAVIQGVMDGYCGCLTTVSTFAAEIREQKARKASIYVLTSWMLGQALLLVIIGSSLWTGAVKGQVTCKFQ